MCRIPGFGRDFLHELEVVVRVGERMCSGALCRIMFLFILRRTGLYSGCSGRTDASRIAAPEHHFSTICVAGKRSALSSLSLGAVVYSHFFCLYSLLAMLHSSLQLLLGLTCTYLVVVYISIRGLSSHRHAFIFCAFPLPLTGLTPYSLPPSCLARPPLPVLC